MTFLLIVRANRVTTRPSQAGLTGHAVPEARPGHDPLAFVPGRFYRGPFSPG
jgi:hypothetical protein